MLSDLEHGDMPETARKVCFPFLFQIKKMQTVSFRLVFHNFILVFCEIWNPSKQEYHYIKASG